MYINIYVYYVCSVSFLILYENHSNCIQLKLCSCLSTFFFLWYVLMYYLYFILYLHGLSIS